MEIGDDTIIAAKCSICDMDWHHLYPQARRRLPGSNFDIIEGDVHIGRNVWIEFISIILKGVTIGETRVIAAGSVVTKNTPPSCIAAGNPAKPSRAVPEVPVKRGRYVPQSWQSSLPRRVIKWMYSLIPHFTATIRNILWF